MGGVLRARSRVCAGIAISLGVALAPEPAPAHPGLHHDWEEATRALEQDPYSAQPRLSRSKVARLEGWRLTAYHEARWARALAPHDAAPHRALGLAALGLGRRGEALDALDAFFTAGGEAFDARVARAEARWAEGRPAEALGDLDQALTLKPDVEAALLRARWHRAQGDLPKAALGLEQILAQVGDALLLRRALVALYLDLGRPEPALALVEAALAKEPRSAEWLMAKARALKVAGRPGAARETLIEALEIAEHAVERRATPLLIAQRAEVRLALGDRAGARRDLDLALHRGPPFPRAVELAAELGVRLPRGSR